jgi:hypothetical protein
MDNFSSKLILGQIQRAMIILLPLYWLSRFLRKQSYDKRMQLLATDTATIETLPVMIYVVANMGYATHFGLAHGARVIFFEPLQSNLGNLLAMVWKNKAGSITPISSTMWFLWNQLCSK